MKKYVFTILAVGVFFIFNALDENIRNQDLSRIIDAQPDMKTPIINSSKDHIPTVDNTSMFHSNRSNEIDPNIVTEDGIVSSEVDTFFSINKNVEIEPNIATTSYENSREVRGSNSEISTVLKELHTIQEINPET